MATDLSERYTFIELHFTAGPTTAAALGQGNTSQNVRGVVRLENLDAPDLDALQMALVHAALESGRSVAEAYNWDASLAHTHISHASAEQANQYNSHLVCPACGGTYSAKVGDYWAREIGDDRAFICACFANAAGTPMHLVCAGVILLDRVTIGDLSTLAK